MLKTGTEIGGFRIESLLGRGGMGVVYRATQLSLERAVALKVVSPELSGDGDFRERFRREARIQAALDHPNIVPVYEAGESTHGFFIAMRLIPGSSLRELIRGDELDAGRSLEILADIALGLDAAHTGGLIHRDVKPHNVLVMQRHGFLADFGLSKGRGMASITSTGHQIGTLAYTAPERIRGERAESASDIYALGAVLYECLTGSVPFLRTSDVEVMYAHLHTPIPKVYEANPDLPRCLDDVLQRAMSKQPEVRQHTATALIAEATEAFGGAGATTPPFPQRTPSAAARPPATRRVGPTATDSVPSRAHSKRHASARKAALVALAGCVSAGGFALGHSRSEFPPPTRPLASRDVSVNVPRAWTPAPGVFSIKLLVTRPAVAAGPPGQTRAGILLGRANAYGPSMLPAVFAHFVRGSANDHPARTSAGVDGLLYPYIRSSANGGQRFSIFVVPTTAGDVIVACVTSLNRPDLRVLRACSQAMNSFTLASGFTFALEPRVGYGQFLTAALGTLLTQTNRGLAQYGAGRDRATQAAAVDRIAGAYAAAAHRFTTLSPIEESPQDIRIDKALRAALITAHNAYRNLGTATRSHGLVAWRIARAQVLAAIDQLGAELDELQKLGYSLS